MITLIGESNPYRSDPRYALWPSPVGCSGWRLCHIILGLTEEEYLSRFERVNLCSGTWDSESAMFVAATLTGKLILCGARVAKAFNFKYELFARGVRGGATCIVIPHPSGLCRVWSEFGMIQRTREEVNQF